MEGKDRLGIYMGIEHLLYFHTVILLYCHTVILYTVTLL